MKKSYWLLVLVPFLVACSGSNTEAIKGSVYYEAAEQVWDSLDTANKSSTCSIFDGENSEAAYALIRIGLKFDLDIDIDENAEKYDEAIKLLLSEKC
jgi:hypothetical protein